MKGRRLPHRFVAYHRWATIAGKDGVRAYAQDDTKLGYAIRDTKTGDWHAVVYDGGVVSVETHREIAEGLTTVRVALDAIDDWHTVRAAKGAR
jgi:hypothetical protein